MNKLEYTMLSTLLGFLVGPVFLFIAILLSVFLGKFSPATTFSAEFPIALSFVIAAIMFFFTTRKIILKVEKEIVIIAAIFFVLSSIFSVWVACNLVSIGP